MSLSLEDHLVAAGVKNAATVASGLSAEGKRTIHDLLALGTENLKSTLEAMGLKDKSMRQIILYCESFEVCKHVLPASRCETNIRMI